MRLPACPPRAARWACALLLLALATPQRGVGVDIKPTSDVLVPYFEVVLDKDCRTTNVAVANVSKKPVNVVATVHSNWGIPLLAVNYRIPADAVWSFGLRDWIVDGKLPGRQLRPAQLQHLQAALSGRPSPLDGLYYGTEKPPGGEEEGLVAAVGYVTIRTRGNPRPDVLWGDYFIYCPHEMVLQGETLVDIDPIDPDDQLCDAHALRFLVPTGRAGATELMIWTPVRLSPSATPEPPQRVSTRFLWYDEAGELFRQERRELLPSEVLDFPEGVLERDYGWVAIAGKTAAFVTGHYAVDAEFSSSLHAWCLPQQALPAEPGILLEKRVQGEDADVPPGPAVPVGGDLEWTFEVRNVGPEDLFEVVVEDDSRLVVTCPKTTLVVGESMVCTAESVAIACQNRNLATVTARTAARRKVTASDAAHYFGVEEASLALETKVQGQMADTPTGPSIAVGAPVALTYEVTNAGEATVTDLVVTDSHGLAVSCPETRLAKGESMTCTAATTAVAGQQVHVGTVNGRASCRVRLSAEDPAYYIGQAVGAPAIDIEKYVNGQDADLAPGPTFPVGTPLAWLYVVANTGNVALGAVTVSDDRGVAVSCPKTTLAVGESMDCTGSGTAVSGPYANIGTATGTPPEGGPVSDQDPCHYTGNALPAGIDIEKYVNGQDADTPPGPELVVGTPLLWTYVVTNVGQVALASVAVTDDRGVAVSCPKTTLAVGESMTCTGSGIAASGPYANIGTATGTPPEGAPVSDQDPCHYTGTVPPSQGCTPGYWKNHTDSWPPTGYSPSQVVKSVFGEASRYPSGSATLLAALAFGGGSDVDGAAEILLRAGVAALLNAAHPDITYPRPPAAVLADVDAALASGSRDTMLSLAAALDADNNAGCPLN